MRAKIHRMSWAAIVLGVTAGMSGPADAAFITYTQTTTGTVSLGGVSYVNVALTFTQTADTANITASPGLYQVPNLTSTVTIPGLGELKFTSPTTTFIVGGLYAGVGRSSDGRPILASLSPPAFFGYDLSMPIGPVLGSALFDPASSFETDRGTLTILSALPVTYQARLGSIAVPEPSSLGLCAVASLGGLVGWVRRRAA